MWGPASAGPRPPKGGLHNCQDTKPAAEQSRASSLSTVSKDPLSEYRPARTPRFRSKGSGLERDFRNESRAAANHDQMPPERPPAEPSDREVLQRAAAGDLEAFSEIYHRHQQTVYRFARAMT